MKRLQREDPFQPILKGKNARKITDPFFFLIDFMLSHCSLLRLCET